MHDRLRLDERELAEAQVDVKDEEEIEEDATMPLQANQNIVTLADISPTGLGVALNKGTSLARNE